MIPLFNLVIKVSAGYITDIVWDNDCFTCPETVLCYNQTAINTNLTDTTLYYDKVIIKKNFRIVK